MSIVTGPVCKIVDCWVSFPTHQALMLWISRSDLLPSQRIDTLNKSYSSQLCHVYIHYLACSCGVKKRSLQEPPDAASGLWRVQRLRSMKNIEARLHSRVFWRDSKSDLAQFWVSSLHWWNNGPLFASQMERRDGDKVKRGAGSTRQMNEWRTRKAARWFIVKTHCLHN